MFAHAGHDHGLHHVVPVVIGFSLLALLVVALPRGRSLLAAIVRKLRK